ncbi:MAG: preprotein translocase subunit SecA [Desulfococcus sp.]|nr:MAG: preprotein translocase subunit SecA [Desulfococcus sp.]
MLLNFLTRLFGSRNERIIRRLQPLVQRINDLESGYRSMDDDELARQTVLFREQLTRDQSTEDLLPEAFAVMREASRRVLDMRHFDVQLIGGMILHQGSIAEMKTGEGKTLVSTLPAYLNALTGKGVHIVTVNDYLARRDAEWMGRVYRFLGLSVGVIVHGLDDDQRKKAYGADITYGTNNEFGFDYLRDNMKFDRESMVQRPLYFAVVDEVDSILVDEARTPLIISGPAEKSTHMYYQVNNIIPSLRKDFDFTVDEKAKSSVLTEEGVEKVQTKLSVENIFDPSCIDLLHHVNQALKAHSLFQRDVDYIVKNGEVIIVDEFTGRLMPGRRYSDGLHQALEAKENVKVANENQTLATITFQNYFRMYEKLSGMTGTADTEAAEFKKIYDLDVVVIPTNRPMIRKDFPDVIYKTKREKYNAVLDEIVALHKKGQPVLVGTISIEVSEELGRKLKKRGVPHTVLNAKHHSREAEIVAQAGRPGSVTIATNMAGRGTDIILGGNWEADVAGLRNPSPGERDAVVEKWRERHDKVLKNGGLHILGTERHESRRIDNQLRGRSGRQGDPGSSRFYLSLDDDLLRIFGGERITGIMEKLGMEEGEPIEHALLSRAIENAQRKVEGHNFDIRKQLLEYDDVMNQQREVIYEQRRQALVEGDLGPTIEGMVRELAENIALEFANEQIPPSEWDVDAMTEAVRWQFGLDLSYPESELEGKNAEDLAEDIFRKAVARYEEKKEAIGPDIFPEMERYLMLNTVDGHWKEHLLQMDHLKEGIGLRGYAQQNPLIVYKKEGFDMFNEMIARIKQEIIRTLFWIRIEAPEQAPVLKRNPAQEMILSGAGGEPEERRPIRRKEEKVGRNDLCPCGSGRKFKKCCGR